MIASQPAELVRLNTAGPRLHLLALPFAGGRWARRTRCMRQRTRAACCSSRCVVFEAFPCFLVRCNHSAAHWCTAGPLTILFCFLLCRACSSASAPCSPRCSCGRMVRCVMGSCGALFAYLSSTSGCTGHLPLTVVPRCARHPLCRAENDVEGEGLWHVPPVGA